MASEITELLRNFNSGDRDALDRLTQLVYDELKSIARRWARSGTGLGATTLVSEAYLRLLSSEAVQPKDKQQFIALTATIMRHVIIDEIRYVSAHKRERLDVTWDDQQQNDAAAVRAEFLLQLDEALDGLDAADTRLRQVFECRYFAGFTTAETAEALGLSERSVERLWHESRDRLASALV